MSQEALALIVDRAASDTAFRTQLARSPEAALAAYDLTAEERAALLRGDDEELRALGVDVRVSKLSRSTADDTELWTQGMQDWQH